MSRVRGANLARTPRRQPPTADVRGSVEEKWDCDPHIRARRYPRGYCLLKGARRQDWFAELAGEPATICSRRIREVVAMDESASRSTRPPIILADLWLSGRTMSRPAEGRPDDAFRRTANASGRTANVSGRTASASGRTASLRRTASAFRPDSERLQAGQRAPPAGQRALPGRTASASRPDSERLQPDSERFQAGQRAPPGRTASA